MNVFEQAESGIKSETEDYEGKSEEEKRRQLARADELGFKSTDDIKLNVFQKAEAQLAKERPTPERPGTKDLPSELNAMRRRLGMQESGPGGLRKIYDFMGQRSGIGASAGAILGTALAPETGGLSILIPALAAAGGGAAGALTEGKARSRKVLGKGLRKDFSAARRNWQNRLTNGLRAALLKPWWVGRRFRGGGIAYEKMVRASSRRGNSIQASGGKRGSRPFSGYSKRSGRHTEKRSESNADRSARGTNKAR